MKIEYKSCPFCHQPSSVAHGKCYACGAMIPETANHTIDLSGGKLPTQSNAIQETASTPIGKRPRRVVFGWFFLSLGLVMMLFFGFIFNSKWIYLNAFGQAVNTITKDPQGLMRRPSSDELGWFVDPDQLEENGMRLGMVFWMSGMLCILLPKSQKD